MAMGTKLEEALRSGSGAPAADDALIDLILRLAEVGREIASLVAKGALAGRMNTVTGEHQDGDVQKVLDVRAHNAVMSALRGAPVAAVASEEAEEVEVLNGGAPYVVAIDPVDGSSNIETNLSIGTIFTILPRGDLSPAEALLQPGTTQCAAGFVMYGPQTVLVLTLGQGTQIYTLDPHTGIFFQTAASVKIPQQTKEYAINGSNLRHWDQSVRTYIADLQAGVEGTRGKDCNTRWIAAMVADAYRILVRGGIYLYPADKRKGYGQGRLRLTYEANPIAFLIEQAGGKATDGIRRILEIPPQSIHQRVPLVFGSADEVEMVRRYHETESLEGRRSPLFSDRNLYRA